jgi:hypothetical protein
MRDVENMPHLAAEVYLPNRPSDIPSKAKCFRINREQNSDIITEKEETITKLTGRYGQFRGNAGIWKHKSGLHMNGPRILHPVSLFLSVLPSCP